MSDGLKIIFAICLLAPLVASSAIAQPPSGRGPGGGPGHDDRHDEDHQVLQFLLTNHEKITRHVNELPNGVETLTESNDPQIAAKIKEHVKWMQYRIDEALPIRTRDPLFAELFRHTQKIEMVRVETEKGVRVTETSDDPFVAKLIKAHAKTVSGFVARGFDEGMKNHAVPDRDQSEAIEYITPAIAKYGKVVQLAKAAQQPRNGSKLVVDVTQGDEPGNLNAAIEKVARFINIYRGAGKEAATVQIAVVLHGDATLTILDADAYAQRFDTQGNPNLDCLHEIHKAGAEIFVCGQSLIGKGAKPEEVAVFADVAVSALTSLVNLQADGYAYVPLGK